MEHSDWHVDSKAGLLILLLLVSLLNSMPLVVRSVVIDVPRDYSGIQLAIDHANPGDVIRVAAGTYAENLKIEKPLTLIGEGSERTVLTKTGTVVHVKAENVEISGFAVRDGTYGIFLWYSQNISLRNNDMSDNTWNFGVWGDSLSHFVHDIDHSNTVDGKPICYWVNQRGERVPNDAGYVALVNCANISVKNLSLTSNEQGVLLVSTNSSLVENVTMLGNDEGLDLRLSHNNIITKNQLHSINWRALFLEDSTGNVFRENTIVNSTGYALSIKRSNGNLFYHNNFIDNETRAYSELSQNLWHDAALQEGNYWSDYTGTDADGDGIGDVPYVVQGSEEDRYPLMDPWDTIPPIAKAGLDQTVTVNQTVTLDASRSTDNLGIISYEWDFGDGIRGVGITTSHVYATVGTWTVELTIKDAAGNVATDTVSVTVVESPISFYWWVPVVGVAAVAGIVVVVGYWRRKSSRN